jgi:hypothetical protein
MIASFDLSLPAVDILAYGLGINCRLFPFQIPSVGHDMDERLTIARVVHDDLHRRGLARRGNLAPEVDTALRLLGEHDKAIAVLGNSSAAGGLYARASVAGANAVVVVQMTTALRFALIRPEELVHSVVHLLPAAPAGPGPSVTITRPATVPVPGSEDGGSFRSLVRAPRTSADAQARVAEDILRRPRRGDGYFIVTPDSCGLSWIDTDAGRYLTHTKTDERGDTHATYFPADGHRVASKLAELLGATARSRPRSP